MNIKEWLKDREQLLLLTIKDVADHGCSGGVSGLIYYEETSKFHDDHEKEIWDLVERFADDSGHTIMQYIGNISKAGSLAQLKNDLAWLAVEVNAQDLLDERGQ
jgi:hypothetical protein